MARFKWNDMGVIARTVTQVAPTATTVSQIFSVTQARGLAMPMLVLANVTNASLSFRVAVAKQTTATAAAMYYASDVALASASLPVYMPLSDLESGDTVWVRTNTASALACSLLAYEIA